MKNATWIMILIIVILIGSAIWLFMNSLGVFAAISAIFALMLGLAAYNTQKMKKVAGGDAGVDELQEYMKIPEIKALVEQLEYTSGPSYMAKVRMIVDEYKRQKGIS